MAKRVPVTQFVQQLAAALNRGDGYIMGARGQDPKKWAKNSWWFTQYSGKQREKALYWREHAARVWDCNGLAEGIYEDATGINIDSKARYNYSQWCDPKGSGRIPAKYRVPGAAVFWGDSASSIHHVGYLWKPVNAGSPGGDWYIIEARGVMYGVVKTRLYSRNPNYWGWMTKYYDYSGSSAKVPDTSSEPRILRNGMEGDDVKALQTNLIRLGYDCGRWGADGDFGDATEMALKSFQRNAGLAADGEYGPLTAAAMEKALAASEAAPETEPKQVEIVGGDCYARSAPNTGGKILGVCRRGTRLTYQGETSENGWHLVIWDGQNAWVSGKYSKVVS